MTDEPACPTNLGHFSGFTNINFHQAFAPWCCIWLAMHSDKRELLHCVMLVAYVPPWYVLSSTTHHMHTCRAINICDEFDEDFLWNDRMEKKMRSWSSRVRDGDWWLNNGRFGLEVAMLQMKSCVLRLLKMKLVDDVNVQRKSSWELSSKGLTLYKHSHGNKSSAP